MYRCWTEAAKECYQRGGDCNGCFYKDTLSTHCFMWKTVKVLLEQLGKPKKITIFNQKKSDQLRFF